MTEGKGHIPGPEEASVAGGQVVKRGKSVQDKARAAERARLQGP